MKIIIVYNPRSGSSASRAELVRYCKAANITVSRYVPITNAAVDLRVPIKNGAIIAVVGGDGTISSVASLLVGSSAVLAPLPGGTLNHFSKDLGVKQDLQAALTHLKTATPRQIDSGMCNDRYFINNSSIGLYPASLADRRSLEKILGKWIAAIIASIVAIVRFRRYTVTIDGATYHTPFVFVGNNDYKLDNLGAAQRTQLNKGRLCVFVARSQSRLRLIMTAFKVLMGKSKNQPDFDTYTAKAITISAHHRLRVAFDGELSSMRSPLAYKSKPGSLTVLV